MKTITAAVGLLLSLSTLAYAQETTTQNTDKGVTCEKRKKTSRGYFYIMNLSLRTDNQKALDKFLFEQCYSPLKPNDPEIVEDPIFSINSIDSYNKMMTAGANFTQKNEHGMDWFDFVFSYNKPFLLTKDDAQVFRQRAKDLLKVLPRGFLTQAELDVHNYNHMADRKKYNELLKFLINNNLNRINIPGKGFGKDMGITPFHYAVYNGNYEVFKYLSDKNGGEVDPNLKNAKGQPLFSTVLNHYCSLDKEGVEGVMKINEMLLGGKKAQLETPFLVNDEKELKTSPLINYKDLLVFYKKHGNQSIYAQTMRLLSKNYPEYYSKIKDDNSQNPSISGATLRAGICNGPHDIGARFYDL